MFSFITHARNQPNILEKHLQVWDALPPRLRDRWEFVLIDDCSYPPVNLRRDYLRVFRSLNRMPWNYGCKNLGAMQARADWFLFTNVDHVLTTEATMKISNLEPEPGRYYRFLRFNTCPDADARYSDRPHLGTLLVHRDDFYAVGGYDEDFSGFYGHDDTFLDKCLKSHGVKQRTCRDIHFENFSQSQITDADFSQNPEWSRDLSRNRLVLKRKLKQKRLRASHPRVRFEWEAV